MPQMAEDATMELMRQQMGGGTAEDNKKLMVKFSIEAVHDHEASEKQGRPVYKDEEFITIWVPGDKDNVPHRPVRYSDKVMYPDQYRAFKEGVSQAEPGTPLQMLPFMSPAQIAEMAHYGVKTAEQLVGMSDGNGQKVMGFQALKQRTQKYLEALAGAAPAQRLQSELSKRDDEIEALKKLISEQADRIEKMANRKPQQG